MHMVGNGEITLDFPGGPNITAKILISERGRLEGQHQNNVCEKDWIGHCWL